jgi:hypothetical protein
MGAKRPLFRTLHPGGDEPLSALGRAQTRRGDRGGRVVSAGNGDGAARDHRQRGSRRRAAISARDARPGMGACLFSDLHRRLLSAAHGESSGARRYMRRSRHRRDARVVLATRPAAARARGRHRRRRDSADLYVGAILAFVVGDDRAALRRRLALSHLRLFLSLHLER